MLTCCEVCEVELFEPFCLWLKSMLKNVDNHIEKFRILYSILQNFTDTEFYTLWLIIFLKLTAKLLNPCRSASKMRSISGISTQFFNERSQFDRMEAIWKRSANSMRSGRFFAENLSGKMIYSIYYCKKYDLEGSSVLAKRRAKSRQSALPTRHLWSQLHGHFSLSYPIGTLLQRQANRRTNKRCSQENAFHQRLDRRSQECYEFVMIGLQIETI